MQFLAEKISGLSIEWNERSLSESDFYRLCDRFKITVNDLPMAVDGFHYRLLGRDFIALDSKLSGLRRLAVMFHELGHCLLHIPQTGPAANFYAVGLPDRQEREADAFALCCLMPRSLIETRTVAELIDLGHSLESVRARLAIFGRYRF